MKLLAPTTYFKMEVLKDLLELFLNWHGVFWLNVRCLKSYERSVFNVKPGINNEVKYKVRNVRLQSKMEKALR